MKNKKEKKKSTFWQDFKAFISRGNIVDLAVAVQRLLQSSIVW